MSRTGEERCGWETIREIGGDGMQSEIKGGFIQQKETIAWPPACHLLAAASR
jgi:hypothetical protein